MSKEMKDGIAAAVAELARFKLERLDHIREKMLESTSLERGQIANLAKDAEGDYLDSLADERTKLVGQFEPVRAELGAGGGEEDPGRVWHIHAVTLSSAASVQGFQVVGLEACGGCPDLAARGE